MSLLEILIACLLLGIVTLILWSSIQMGLGYWGRTNDLALVEQNVRVGLNSMVSDLQQAAYPTDAGLGAVVVPNLAADPGPTPPPCPPPVPPSPVPGVTGATLDFFEPIATAFVTVNGGTRTFNPGFDTTQAHMASNYQEVVYSLQTAPSPSLVRTINGGAPTTVVSTRSGTLTLETWIAAPNLVGLYLASTEGTHRYELQTFVHASTR